jgi:hypothetical protein
VYPHVYTICDVPPAFVKVIGRWAAVLFLLGAAMVAFNSIMPVTWAVVFIFMNVPGKTVQDIDRSFQSLF